MVSFARSPRILLQRVGASYLDVAGDTPRHHPGDLLWHQAPSLARASTQPGLLAALEQTLPNHASDRGLLPVVRTSHNLAGPPTARPKGALGRGRRSHRFGSTYDPRQAHRLL